MSGCGLEVRCSIQLSYGRFSNNDNTLKLYPEMQNFSYFAKIVPIIHAFYFTFNHFQGLKLTMLSRKVQNKG